MFIVFLLRRDSGEYLDAAFRDTADPNLAKPYYTQTVRQYVGEGISVVPARVVPAEISDCPCVMLTKNGKFYGGMDYVPWTRLDLATLFLNEEEARKIAEKHGGEIQRVEFRVI